MERSQASAKENSAESGMKTGSKRLLVVFFWLYAGQGACAELLGGISDETAQVAGQEQAPADKKGRITYRVICP